jgi:crossover junction endodeoxyribonuclease RuvC
MRVCGIDPGLHTSGYGVVERLGGTLRIIDAGVCRTDAAADLPHRLVQIDTDFSALLEQHPVDVVAVEQLYTHYKHPRTAVVMGHARGVMICAAARLSIAVRHYAATQVKRFLTGNGRASKSQVQQAIASAYGLRSPPEPADVADALAVALCCAYDDVGKDSHFSRCEKELSHQPPVVGAGEDLRSIVGRDSQDKGCEIGISHQPSPVENRCHTEQGTAHGAVAHLPGAARR